MKPPVLKNSKIAEIHLLNGQNPICISLEENNITVEDACTIIAAKLGITPICRLLFTLKHTENGEWLPPHLDLQSLTPPIFAYRLRFKIATPEKLKELDLKAFDYYYHQVRRDVLSTNVWRLSYEKEESAILGLTVADMYRVMLEDNVSLTEIEPSYKSYTPQVILKKHQDLFTGRNRVKSKVMASLKSIACSGLHREVNYVKLQYLKHFELTAKEYLVEEFEVKVDKSEPAQFVQLRLDAYHKEMPGLQQKDRGDASEWSHVCSIEDLCFVAIRDDGAVEIYRKNGIPVYYSFPPKKVLSFASLLDGYYRLSVKWMFNLCTEIISPSLQKLRQIKCHGPVGGQFSYAKLQEKRDNKPGTFILRECEKMYNVIYLDVCQANSFKPRTYRIQMTAGIGGSCTFSYDNATYPSIGKLIATYKTGEFELVLLECLPPAEDDKSQVLICSTDSFQNSLAAVTNPEEVLLSAAPRCIKVQNLQIFPSSRRESRSGKTVHFRGMWKHKERSRVEVSIKELKPELRERCLSEFLELAGQWAGLLSGCLTKLYGVTLAGRVTMISEYLSLGPLDQYLLLNHDVEPVQMVEAACSIAKALWQLEEAGMTHGYLRCRKVMVAARTLNSLSVKLSDPGLHSFTEEDIPWIPPEFFNNMAFAKYEISADVWAFGTTVWEIFSRGKKPTDLRGTYSMNKRLRKPFDCPEEIYQVMKDCWIVDVFARKRPQAIVRDICHIYHQVYHSGRVHSYQTPVTITPPPEDSHSLSESGGSMRSDVTSETLLMTDFSNGEQFPLCEFFQDDADSSSTDQSISSESDKINIFRHDHYSQQVRPDLATVPLGTGYHNFISENIYQLGRNCNVTLNKVIGSGNYGVVYQGVLERSDHEAQMVAVKRLKRGVHPAPLDDFKREIAIMKGLLHENIVTIIGEIPGEVSLIMEFVRLGSLHGYLRINSLVLKTHNLLKFAEDIAKGMEYLGLKRIVHRDLAARNILVADENNVKISDFGLAQFVTSGNDYYMLQTCRAIPIKWYAPESLEKGGFSKRSDVWSYGVTLYEIFSLGEDPQLDGNPDLQGIEQQLEALKSGLRLPCPPREGAQVVYRTMMVPCWQLESRRRPTFTKLLEMIAQIRDEGI